MVFLWFRWYSRTWEIRVFLQWYRNCFVLLWCKTFRYYMGFQSCLLLLIFGCCGQKRAWPFRSWNSEIYCNSREWIDIAFWYKFRKANINFKLSGGHGQKWVRPLDHMGLKNQGYFTYDLISQADWFNNFLFDQQSTLYLWHLLDAVVLVQNGVLLLLHTEKYVLELCFSKCFLTKAWLNVKIVFPV